MINELRTATLNWLQTRVGDLASCYCDLVPDNDNGNTVLAFNISNLQVIYDIANRPVHLTFDIDVYINSRDRTNIDNVADILMYDDTDGSDGNFENIFYRDFRDLDYNPSSDSYYCSILSLNIKANINGQDD